MDVTSSGRPKRRTRKVVDYKEQSGDSPYDLEKYLEKVRKESEQRWVIMVHDTNSALYSLATDLIVLFLLFFLLLLQLHSRAAGPVSSGRPDQPEAPEHSHAAEEVLQPPLLGGVPAGSCHSGVQGIITSYDGTQSTFA